MNHNKFSELMKDRIKNLFHAHFYSRRSYAQEGEDLVLDRLFQGRRDGFYIEIGCHHPYRFSNTFLFYQRGWRGICIDPLPGTKKLFNQLRPRDMVVESGVSDERGLLEYFMFNEPALNTFDRELVAARTTIKQYRVVATQKVGVRPLKDILSEYAVPNDIDFISVDVEGLDLHVLRSNDWTRYRPQVVVVECLKNRDGNDMVAAYLKSLDYAVYAITGNSVLYKRAQ